MVPDKTVYSFIVRDSVSWPELNNDFLVCISLDYPFCLVKCEDVIWVSEKLKLCIEL